jgi:hypothetical protein
MMAEPSWIIIGLSAFVVLGLFAVIGSFSLPKSYLKNKQTKEKLRDKFLREQIPPSA